MTSLSYKTYPDSKSNHGTLALALYFSLSGTDRQTDTLFLLTLSKHERPSAKTVLSELHKFHSIITTNECQRQSNHKDGGEATFLHNTFFLSHKSSLLSIVLFQLLFERSRLHKQWIQPVSVELSQIPTSVGWAIPKQKAQSGVR